MHGGTVSVSSPGPGRGSEFVVRLPILVYSPIPAGPIEVEPVSSGAGDALVQNSMSLTILLIEDNEDIRDSLRTLLELMGHQVEAAADGTTGLDMVLSQAPNVALIDIGLPGMNGYRLAERIREEAACRGIRLIAMTGYGQRADRERAFAAGFDAHLVKPVDLDELHRALEDCVRALPLASSQAGWSAPGRA
jgi:CheY-like chemotaxis protein